MKLKQPSASAFGLAVRAHALRDYVHPPASSKRQLVMAFQFSVGEFSGGNLQGFRTPIVRGLLRRKNSPPQKIYSEITICPVLKSCVCASHMKLLSSIILLQVFECPTLTPTEDQEKWKKSPRSYKNLLTSLLGNPECQRATHSMHCDLMICRVLLWALVPAMQRKYQCLRNHYIYVWKQWFLYL